MWLTVRGFLLAPVVGVEPNVRMVLEEGVEPSYPVKDAGF
jgi:hypothetical protein